MDNRANNISEINMKKGERLKRAAFLYVLYTLVFAGMAYVVFKYFGDNGKTLVGDGDAWRQHIKAVAYYSKWLRGVLYELVHNHSLRLQTFALGMGYGSDMYTTLQYYALGDILNLPSAFVKTEYIHIYFQAVILLRAYLAGITFIMFVRYIRPAMRIPSVIAGACIYCFSSYFMYLGIWHPFFANPLIYLPLVLLGAEKLIREKKPLFFAVSVFLAGTNNFYFFYIIVLLTIIYVLIRLVFTYAGKNIRDFLSAVLSFAIYGALGTMMAMFILLPILLAFPNNPRVSSGIKVTLFYSAEYYKELIKNVTTFVYHGQNDTQLGVTYMFVFALMILIARCITELIKGRKGALDIEASDGYLSCGGGKALWQELLLLVLMTVFLCIPYCGYTFAAFSYAINRWCFACALFAGFITAESVQFIADVITSKKRTLSPVLQTVLLAATLFMIWQNADLAYSPDKVNMIRDYMDKCTPEEMYMQLQSTEVQVVEENAAQEGLDVAGDFYRYSGRDLVWNASLLDGISSTQFFWSLADKKVPEYFMQMANNDQQNFAYYALDDRPVLNALAGVRYFSLRFDTPDQQCFVPYGYERSYGKYNFAIFENTDAMPFAFTYSNVIPEADYKEMAPIEREEALLYGAVVADDAASDLPEAEPLYTSEKLDVKITLDGDIKEKKGKYKTKAGGAIILSFEGKPNAETLLWIKNLHATTSAEVPSVIVSTTLSDGTYLQKNIDYKTEYSQYYSGWHDFLVDMGYSGEAKTDLRVTFTEPGTYTFDEIGVYSRALTNMHAQLSALKAHTMQNVDLHKNPISFATNRITGSIDTDDDELLFLQIPYSRGWSATVDGKKADILQVNTMFSGIRLDAGHHDIVLTYHTPGLVVGLIISILALAALIILTCYINRRAGE